jgi:hypothetical protein
VAFGTVDLEALGRLRGQSAPARPTSRMANELSSNESQHHWAARSGNLSKLAVGDLFPTAQLKDIDDVAVEFPAVFANAPATVIFFIGAAGDRGDGPR